MEQFEIGIDLTKEAYENIINSFASDWVFYKINLLDYMETFNLSGADIINMQKESVGTLPGRDEMKYDTIYYVNDSGECYIRDKDNDNTLFNIIADMPQIVIDYVLQNKED